MDDTLEFYPSSFLHHPTPLSTCPSIFSHSTFFRLCRETFLKLWLRFKRLIYADAREINTFFFVPSDLVVSWVMKKRKHWSLRNWSNWKFSCSEVLVRNLQWIEICQEFKIKIEGETSGTWSSCIIQECNNFLFFLCSYEHREGKQGIWIRMKVFGTWRAINVTVNICSSSITISVCSEAICFSLLSISISIRHENKHPRCVRFESCQSPKKSIFLSTRKHKTCSQNFHNIFWQHKIEQFTFYANKLLVQTYSHIYFDSYTYIYTAETRPGRRSRNSQKSFRNLIVTLFSSFVCSVTVTEPSSFQFGMLGREMCAEEMCWLNCENSRFLSIFC